MHKVKFLSIFTILAVVLVALAGISYAVSAIKLGATSPTLVNLLPYSVLGSTAVTNTGNTTVQGNLGVTTGSSITGFPPGIVGPPGTIHENDASAIAAKAELLTVYDALDQPCDQTFPVGGDLPTLFPAGVGPGTYCSGSSFTVNGDLTLTGTGVWIFRTVSTLITAPGARVLGGDPCNVWWRVETSATLDTTTEFIGNILALDSITMNDGATLNGRALARNGSVTLINNVITSPVCAVVPTITPRPTNTRLPVVTGLPSSGSGAPIQNDFPLGWLMIGGFSLTVLVFGARGYHRAHLPKK